MFKGFRRIISNYARHLLYFQLSGKRFFKIFNDFVTKASDKFEFCETSVGYARMLQDSRCIFRKPAI